MKYPYLVPKIRKKSKTKKKDVMFADLASLHLVFFRFIAAKIYRSLLGVNVKSMRAMAGHRIRRSNAGLGIGVHTFDLFISSIGAPDLLLDRSPSLRRLKQLTVPEPSNLQCRNHLADSMNHSSHHIFGAGVSSRSSVKA